MMTSLTKKTKSTTSRFF